MHKNIYSGGLASAKSHFIIQSAKLQVLLCNFDDSKNRRYKGYKDCICKSFPNSSSGWCKVLGSKRDD